MSYRFDKRYLLVLAFTAAYWVSLPLPILHADMEPKEILRKADEARGNAAGGRVGNCN